MFLFQSCDKCEFPQKCAISARCSAVYLKGQTGAFPKRALTPERVERCELIQAISLAVADAFKIEDVQRLGLVVDEAMRKMEE